MKCSSLSASRIKTYIACPFKLYLTSHIGIDMGTNFGAEQGTLVHDILEEFGIAMKDGVDHPEIEKTWVDKVMAAYQGTDGIWSLARPARERNKKCSKCSYNNDGKCFIADMPIDSKEFVGCPANEFKQALGLVEMVINDDTPNSPFSKKVLDAENKFVLRVWHEDLHEEIPVVGYIDVVTEIDSDTIEIWDYKTGKYIQDYDQCMKDPQPLIYHLASRTIYPEHKNIIVTMYYMKGNSVSLSYTPQHEEGTIKSLKYYWQTIRADVTPKRKCDGCNGTKFDWKCKYLCDPEICKKEFDKFIAQGGCIHDNSQKPYDESKHKNKK